MALGHPFNWHHFELHLCTSEAAYKRLLKRIKFPLALADPWLLDDAGAATHEVQPDGDARAHVIVCIPLPKSEEDRWTLIGLLVHEAVHVWQAVRDHISEQNPSSEFEAYAVQSAFEKLLAEYRKQIDKAKK
jgi:hypothetical protein